MTWSLPTVLLLLNIFVLLLLLWSLCRRAKHGGSLTLEPAIRSEFRLSRDEAGRQARELREEISGAQGKANESQMHSLKSWSDAQKQDIIGLREKTDSKLEAIRQTMEERLANGERVHRQAVSELKEAMTNLTETLRAELASQRERIITLLAELQAANDRKLSQIQEGNEKKLDQMRQIVDEKLQSTLEKRLGESFKLVSTQLEAVQRGLGEMQTLATGVGDLKRVLTNVKERGTWGEYQLEAILEQVLTPDQFARNVTTKPGGGPVEFAIKLPGRQQGEVAPVWLPIDAKFPKEDYERLVEAARLARADDVAEAAKALANAVKRSAKDIHDKYIEPPATTDFGIMFLPTEGLYAEVLRQAGLHDEIQQNFRVLVAGPTTLAAILNSLRVGFQTLAIEKRAHEVWNVLGAVKTEFSKFGNTLARLKRQISAASNTIDQSQVRTRAMERCLKEVQELPREEAVATLALPSENDLGEDEITDADAEEALQDSLDKGWSPC